MQTIIIKTDNKKAKAIKQFLNAFGISFETLEEDSPYDPAFVKKILKARSEKGERIINPDKLWESLR